MKRHGKPVQRLLFMLHAQEDLLLVQPLHPLCSHLYEDQRQHQDQRIGNDKNPGGGRAGPWPTGPQGRKKSLGMGLLRRVKEAAGLACRRNGRPLRIRFPVARAATRQGNALHALSEARLCTHILAGWLDVK